MRTDKQVHQLFAATPELVFELAGLPSVGPCKYESITLKEVEQRLDGLICPDDSSKPQVVVEVQFYRDDWIFDRILSELHRVRWMSRSHDVKAVVIFGRRDLEPADHPDRSKVTVVYLDEALAKLATRDPAHPAVAAFAPLLTTDRPMVANRCKLWYETIKTSGALDPEQRTSYVEVFLSWLLQRLGLKNLKDLDMLITDLPELEDTDFYRLVLEKGEARGEAKGAADALLRFGRRFWGPEPTDVPALLDALTKAQLDILIEQVPNLPNWDALKSKIPATTSAPE